MQFPFILYVLQFKCDGYLLFSNKKKTVLKAERGGVCCFFITDHDHGLYRGLVKQLLEKCGVSLEYSPGDVECITLMAFKNLDKEGSDFKPLQKNIIAYFFHNNGECNKFFLKLERADDSVHKNIHDTFFSILGLDSLHTADFQPPPFRMKADGIGFSIDFINKSNECLQGFFLYLGVHGDYFVLKDIKKRDAVYWVLPCGKILFNKTFDMTRARSPGSVIISLYNDFTMVFSKGIEV